VRASEREILAKRDHLVFCSGQLRPLLGTGTMGGNRMFKSEETRGEGEGGEMAERSGTQRNES